MESPSSGWWIRATLWSVLKNGEPPICPPLYRHTESQNCTCRKGFLQGIQSKPLRSEYLHGQIFQSPGTSPSCHDLSKMTERDLTMTTNSSTSTLGCFPSGPMDFYVRSVGLKGPCLYRPLCFTLTHSAGKGSKCFFPIPFNINLGGQSCEWVQKAIKQSHGIKIHQDCSMRCWYHHLIPIFIPKAARQSDAKHRKPHNMVTALLCFSLCICARSPFLMAYTEKE